MEEDSVMDPSTDKSVDPELKATITNLVSALGGPDVTQVHRPYKLGDDALACLIDIKKWIRGYDERLDRWDVARIISDTSLITSDLLEILTQWDITEENGNSSKHMDRIALASLELLVPLTWPLELNKVTSTTNHFRHAPYLSRARLRYKRAILTHPQQRILKAVLRLGLPSLEEKNRSTRDDGILKLVLYFFRNLLSIELADDNQRELAGDDVSRSTAIIALEKQSFLELSMSMSANMSERSYQSHSPIMLECLFYILRGVGVKELFPTAPTIASSTTYPSESSRAPDLREELNGNDLSSLLTKEKKLRLNIQRNTSSRHNRFGTMVSMITANRVRLTVSGQPGLSGTADTLDKLDVSKKWRRPGGKFNEEGEQWNKTVRLDTEAKVITAKFVEDFLDYSFNDLFISVRKLIEQDSDKILDEHRMQYLYLVGWFLEAERNRRVKRKIEEDDDEIEIDFGLVAGALDQRTFVVLMKLMRECFEQGEGQNLQIVYSSMLCFTQVLHIVEDMEFSISEEDQEMADNMKSRLFYEEHSLDVLAKLPRNALRQSHEYLRAAIELTHVLLRTLEKFSKQHTALYIRSKRNRKKKQRKPRNEDEMDQETDYGSEAEANRVTSERKFEFKKFESRFINESTIEAYIRFLSNYQELSYSELKWGLSFIHRIFFKRDCKSYFFSLEFMRLLDNILSSKRGLPASHSMRVEFNKFMKHYVHRLEKALEQTPSLYVELMFSKMPEALFYMDHGYDEVKKPKTIRNAATWKFKDPGLPKERQFAIIIAVLLDEDNRNLVDWITEKLSEILTKRSKVNEPIPGTSTVEILDEESDHLISLEDDSSEYGRYAKRDGKFRLLLDLIGFQLPAADSKQLVLPGSVSTSHIDDANKYLSRFMYEVLEFDEPGKVASDFIMKEQSRKRSSGDISEDEVDNGEMDGFLAPESDNDNDDNELILDDSRFGALPEEERLARKLQMKKHNEQVGVKKSTKKRKSDEGTKKKSKGRVDHRANEAQKRGKIKSSAIIQDSDDDEDEERDRKFFDNERHIRETIMGSMLTKPISKGSDTLMEDVRNVSRTASPEVANAHNNKAETDSEDENLFLGNSDVEMNDAKSASNSKQTSSDLEEDEPDEFTIGPSIDQSQSQGKNSEDDDIAVEKISNRSIAKRHIVIESDDE